MLVCVLCVHACACVCVSGVLPAFVSVGSGVCAFLHDFVCVCVCAVRACVHACLSVFLRARVCVYACVQARVSAYGHARVHEGQRPRTGAL